MATAVSVVLSAISQQQGAAAPAASAPAPVAVSKVPDSFDLATPPGETREMLIPESDPPPTRAMG
eukprot:11256742-Alexandrium_andersonii.AAC.1